MVFCYDGLMDDPCFYRVSVKGLSVDENGRFLLIREDNGKWELPGGGLDHGEGPIQGLKREIQEETGLIITYVSPSPKYFITSPRLSQPTFTANIIYEIKLNDLNFTPSEECQEARYFSVDESKKIDKFPNVEKFLEVYDIKQHVA